MNGTISKDKSESCGIPFVTTPSLSLLCPICHEVCHNPVITPACHHSYCRGCITKSLEYEPYCPLCRRRLRREELHPNLALAGLISELPVFCRYKDYGCDHVIPLESREYHQRNCPFAPSICSYNSIGCGYTGTTSEVTIHENNECVFGILQPYIQKTEKRILELEKKLESQTQLIETLIRQPMLNHLPMAQSASLQLDLLNYAKDKKEEIQELTCLEKEPVSKFPEGDISCVATIREHQYGVTSLAYHQGSIYSGSHHGIIKVFDESSKELISSFQAHDETIWALAVDELGQLIYSTGKDATIKAWNLTPSMHPLPLCTLTGHENKIYALTMQDQTLYSGSADTCIKVWGKESTKDSFSCMSTLQAHVSCINSLKMYPNFPFLCSGSNDKTVKLWDVTQLECTRTYHLDTEVLSLAVQDQLLFASTYNAAIAVFDWRTPQTQPLLQLLGHRWETWQLSSLDSCLFTGSFDHTIKRWDLTSFQCTATLEGHQGYVHAMCLADQALISGCADKAIKIWK